MSFTPILAWCDIIFGEKEMSSYEIMYCLLLSLSLSLTHNLSLSYSLLLSLTHTYSILLSLSITYTHTLSLSIFLSLSHTFLLYHKHTHTLSLSIFLSLSYTLSHTSLYILLFFFLIHIHTLPLLISHAD